jgi:hypothetical protein
MSILRLQRDTRDEAVLALRTDTAKWNKMSRSLPR